MSTKRNRNLPQQLTLDHVSPATRLLEKRRHMFEVQEALDAQKEEFQRREATFKRREEMLKKKDLELQESLIKFNKFLQENDSKRGRAEKKEKEEIKQRSLKEQEIVRLNEQLQRQKAQRHLMTLDLQKKMKYQYFLESVLDAAEEFPEISDLLSRHDTLDAAQRDLIKRQSKAAEDNDKMSVNLRHFVREKTDEILGCNNMIAEIQKESELATERVLEEQASSDRQIVQVTERTKQLGQVLMACENIYQRCCDRSSVARSRKASADEDETMVLKEKLQFIRDYLTDLTAITKGFKLPEKPKGEPSGSSPEKGPMQVSSKREDGNAGPKLNASRSGAGGTSVQQGGGSSRDAPESTHRESKMHTSRASLSGSEVISAH